MYRYQINTPQHTPTEHRLPGGVVTRPPIRQTKQTAQETLNTRYSKKNLLVPLIHCVPTGITGLSLHSGMWDVAKVRCQMVSPLIKHSGGAGQQIQKFHLDILSFLFIHFAGARNTNTDTITMTDSLTRVTKSYLLALGTTQISSLRMTDSLGLRTESNIDTWYTAAAAVDS